jgi:hypothetical protein
MKDIANNITLRKKEKGREGRHGTRLEGIPAGRGYLG